MTPDLSLHASQDRDHLAQRFASVQARIAKACAAAGRDPDHVRLLPVTKTVPAERLRLAHDLGYHWFGENTVQEARDKAAALADLAVQWCIIGHLQRNKARHVARFAHELHSLDSLDTAAELDRRLLAEGRSLRVLVQVNTSAEANKSGLAPDAVPAVVRELAAFSTLQVAGFMTLAMASPEPEPVRRCFALLRQVRDRARQDDPAGRDFPELSMGMSGDFELAIAEGATIVRVGQAIFGARTD